MNFALCIIAYNRLESLKNVVDSVSRAYYDQEVSLIISVDKSDNPAVLDYANHCEWEYGQKRVISHSEKLGLRKHVLKCGDLVNEYDGLIVLEDDVIVAESFFLYAKACVQKYKDEDSIAGISLYNFPINYQNLLPFYPLKSDSDVFLMSCAQSWGQVWMPRQWLMFRKWYDMHSDEFGEEPHLPKAICNWPQTSWLKYHTRYCIEQHKYFVYPYVSFSTNSSDAGTHVVKKSTLFQSQLFYGLKRNFNLNPTICYDGFFENESLCDVLGFHNELCIDFYDEKQNRMHCRFWLTRRHLPYKIVKSFALELCPYEQNVYLGIYGDDLFLYDTTIQERNKFNVKILHFLYYIYYLSNLKFLFKILIRSFKY